MKIKKLIEEESKGKLSGYTQDIAKHELELILKYSHDYKNDTTMLRTSAGTIVLTFTSEDPDYGTEVAVFRGKTLSQIAELLNIASEGKSTEELQEDGEEEAANIRAEYMTTSLYAWHNMFCQLQRLYDGLEE